MVRAIFKSLVLAAAGPLPGQFTDENLAKWTELRKGTFSRELDERVTHLLCTEDILKERGPRVKAALRQYKKIHLVNIEWLNISCIREKKQKEKEYDLRKLIEAEKEEERRLARVEKGNLEEERFVNSNLFHTYRDGAHFPYEVTLTRDDEETGNVGQKYILYLFESNAKPHLYWFAAKFWRKKRDNKPSYYRPTTCSGLKTEHDCLFTSFFRKKTGVEWCDRVVGAGVSRKGLFRYMPPTGGKPVGEDLQQTIHSETEHSIKAVVPLTPSSDSTTDAIIQTTNETMVPTKRKGDVSPDLQDTLDATDTPKKRRGRPRKDPLAEDVPKDEGLASLGIPPSKDNETDEDYVPGKKSSTPRKPKKRADRKKSAPGVEMSSRDCTPAEDAAPKKVTPEKRGVVTRDSSEDPFKIEIQSKGGVGGEKGNAEGPSNARGSSDAQRFPNTQYGTQSVQNTDMKLGSDVLLARLVKTYRPIYDAHNKATNLSGLSGKLASNAPQVFGATYGLEAQHTAKVGGTFGQGLKQPIQDFNALMDVTYSSAQTSSGYAPRSANHGQQMMAQNQLACRSGSFVPSKVAQMEDPFVDENPQRGGLHNPIVQSLISKHELDHYLTMGSDYPNVGISHMAQNHVNMQGLGAPLMGSPLASGFPSMAENLIGYSGQATGRTLPGHQMLQMPDDYILSSSSTPSASHSMFGEDHSRAFPLDVFAHAGLTSGDRPELEPFTEVKKNTNLQKPGVNSKLGKTQAQARCGESFFAVESNAEGSVKDQPVAENKVADTNNVESCDAVTKPGTGHYEAVDMDGNKGDDNNGVQDEDEDQKANMGQGKGKGACKVKDVPSSAEKPQARATTPERTPASQLEQQQAATYDSETTNITDKPGYLDCDQDNYSNTRTQDDTMAQNKVPKPAEDTQSEGEKKKFTPWEEYLQTPEGRLLLYGSAGKPKPNLHIDLPTFNAANLKIPESKRKRNVIQHDAVIQASGQQVVPQEPHANTSQRCADPGVSRRRRPTAYFTDPMLSQDLSAPTAFAA